MSRNLAREQPEFVPDQNNREKAKERRTGLPEQTRSFVQLAFAYGAAEKLDEPRKWLLVRYVVDDSLALNDVKMYAGVTTREGARKLYHKALKDLWASSPAEVRQRYPEVEILQGKRQFSSEARTAIRAKRLGKKHSKETKDAIGSAQKHRKRKSKFATEEERRAHRREYMHLYLRQYRQGRKASKQEHMESSQVFPTPKQPD